MSNQEIIRALKVASADDFRQLLEKILPTPTQRDIIRLRFMGYNPADFPNNEYLRDFRVGERLYNYQIALALNVSENTVKKEIATLLKRIKRAGYLEWGIDND